MCRERSQSCNARRGGGWTVSPLRQDAICGRKVVEGGLGDPQTCGGGGGVEAPCCSNSEPVTLWHRNTLKDGASSDGRSGCYRNRPLALSKIQKPAAKCNVRIVQVAEMTSAVRSL